MKETFILDERCIPSEDVRKFINGIGWKFTDYEIASLVFNNPMYNERKNLKTLSDMIDMFTDEDLLEEIDLKVAYENETIKRFKEADDNTIFILWLFAYDDQVGPDKTSDPDSILFWSYDEAYKAGRRAHPKYGFHIMKYHVYGTSKYLTFDKDGDNIGSPEIACASYDSTGEMEWCDIYEYDLREEIQKSIGIDSEEPTLFEILYVAVPNPFKVGDILYDMSYNALGIARAKLDWEKYKDIPLDDRIETLCEEGDSSDAQIPIEVLNRRGRFYHNHSMIVSLRYATDSDYVNEEQKEAFKMAQYLVHGDRLYFQEFQMYLDAYAASDKPDDVE